MVTGQSPLGESTSPAFEQDPPTCSIPSLQTMLMRPWILRLAAQDRVIQNPIQSLCTRGGAVALRLQVSTLMRLSTGTLIRVRRCKQERRGPRGWAMNAPGGGRSVTCLMAPPFPSIIMSHGRSVLSSWKGNVVQWVPRSLCPVHRAPPQALNPRNVAR